MHLLGPIPHQAFHKLSTRCGPLVYFFIGSIPCVLASSPEMAKEILKTNENNFLNRPKAANLHYLTYGSSDFATVPYGPHWKFMKKLCMTELLGGRVLDQLRPIRREETKRFLRLMMKKAEAREEVNVGEELMRLTNNTITRMTLGQRCSDNEDEAGEVRKMVKDLIQLGSKFNLSDTIWFCKNLDLQGFRKKLKNARDRYDVLMERIMKEHEDERKKKKKEMGDYKDETVKDMLDILLDIFEDENAEMRLTRENIKAFIMYFHMIPFGSGRRSCPGATLALQFVPTTLAAIIQCFELKVGGNGGSETVDMEEGPGLTIPRAHSLVCKPVPTLRPLPPI
ncbi:hypothetical protein JRO89_XS01G0385000 [Xanthoceras sorbifolium]|uniref:Flavone synthase II n=1 Tax=Xanthoceras sorbifolium TaxID=99658 RepID=A0ABQ8IP54_9ROSI|nr:hypothetical protein JRO89_XS01G0385000 [Xanthoceras sorbifolium]